MTSATRLSTTFFAGLFLAFSAASAGAKPVASPIDTARLSAITRDLAADEFEGRAPGSAGETRTVDYLVAHLRALGLEPGGKDGSWTQEVPLLRTRVDQTAPLRLQGRQGERLLVQSSDIYVSTQRDIDRARIESAPLVFVGYGVSAPEKQWDDYKGADLTGKVAVFLVNDPDFAAAPTDPQFGRFGGKAMTYYGRWSYKFEEAARRGAVAALIVHQTDAAGYGWSTVAAPQGENFDLAGKSDRDGLALQGWLSGEAARVLFAGAGQDLAKLSQAAKRPDFRPVELAGLSLSADVAVTREYVVSRNVLARITGRSRPAETVIFGAHWDAYGLGEKPDDQSRLIRSGALDDALGVAGVIEIAHAFKAGPRPARTVVFGFWTAEERGLLGSEHFMNSGLYAPKDMVANLTLDTLQPIGPARDVVLIGQGQSSLERDLAQAAQAQHRTVTADAKPERGLFYRADHFSFVKRGVPSLLFMALGGAVDLETGGREKGEAWVADFTARCYHQACDRWDANWDLRGAAQDIDLAYAIGRKFATTATWAVWYEGSEFKTLRREK